MAMALCWEPCPLIAPWEHNGWLLAGGGGIHPAKEEGTVRHDIYITFTHIYGTPSKVSKLSCLSERAFHSTCAWCEDLSSQPHWRLSLQERTWKPTTGHFRLSAHQEYSLLLLSPDIKKIKSEIILPVYPILTGDVLFPSWLTLHDDFSSCLWFRLYDNFKLCFSCV